MGSLRVTLCAIAALGTVAVTPAAYAADGADGGVSVRPSSPHPGGDVALLVSGCREKTALAVSDDTHAGGSVQKPRAVSDENPPSCRRRAIPS